MTNGQHQHDEPTRFGDFMYGALYSAAIGGSVVALGFLLVDFAAARPLFTPSLLGSVLFFGADAATFAAVDLNAVALFTVVHFLAFAGLGGLGSYIYQRLWRQGREAPLPVGATILVVGEVGFLVASWTVMPGVAERIGHMVVLGANVLAAVTMGAFLRWAYRQRPDVARRGGTPGEGGERPLHTA